MAWDWNRARPFPGTNRLPAAYSRYDRQHADHEIERLIDQKIYRTTALKAQIRILADQAAGLTSLAAIGPLLTQLPSGDSSLLQPLQTITERAGNVRRTYQRLQTASYLTNLSF